MCLCVSGGTQVGCPSPADLEVPVVVVTSLRLCRYRWLQVVGWEKGPGSCFRAGDGGVRSHP